MQLAPWAVVLAGCGVDPPPLDGPPVVPAESLFVIAHFDDDMIFMQPELVDALRSGSVTTVYVTSGDPKYGDARAERNFGAARIAYTSVLGSSNFDCGYLLLDGSPIHHCRWTDRPVSLIGLDVPDGGRDGEYAISPLHLVEQSVTSVPILGPVGGTATQDSIIDLLAAVITETKPAEIHALDLAANHGRDHSSHLFSSSFAFWGAARIGYQGMIHWHRGYNVDLEPATLGAADYEAAKTMLGYFEACYFDCARCGSSCTTLNAAHDTWLWRQYSSSRSPLDTLGTLTLEGAPWWCVSVTGTGLGLADCAGATQVQLDATGHLTVAGSCIASAPDNAGPVVLEPCSNSPAQYWLSDSEGHLWNGRPPGPTTNMDFDHVRCLSAELRPGAVVAAPICGAQLSPTWRFGSN